MGKLVCFGEIMMRLNPKGYLKFSQAREWEISFAGGEANVAVSVNNFGETAEFVSKLPENDIAQMAINNLRGLGVNTSKVVRGGERVGTYFIEKGASQRASRVIYDRKHSAIAQASDSDFDWDEILKDVTWFHFTGITPALSDSLAAITLEALKKCKEKGITVSCDLNYRKNLWSKEKAGSVMATLMPYVNLCIANEEDASDVFGIKADDTDLTKGKVNHDGYKQVAKALADKFDFDKVAITLRGSISANDNNWAAMLYDGEEYYFSKNYLIHVVDRVGGGDSFGGALIYTQMNNYESQKSIEFAVAASCLKHSIEFDFNLVTKEEVEKLMGGDGSGRVQR